jgi:hypothetical protein
MLYSSIYVIFFSCSDASINYRDSQVNDSDKTQFIK